MYIFQRELAPSAVFVFEQFYFADAFNFNFCTVCIYVNFVKFSIDKKTNYDKQLCETCVRLQQNFPTKLRLFSFLQNEEWEIVPSVYG